MMVPIDTVRQLEEERENMKRWEDLMEMKEPRSNSHMTWVYHQRH